MCWSVAIMAVAVCVGIVVWHLIPDDFTRYE